MPRLAVGRSIKRKRIVVISAQVAQQRPRRPHPRGPLVDPWPLDASSVPPLTPALVLRFPVGPLPAAEWRIGRWLGEAREAARPSIRFPSFGLASGRVVLAGEGSIRRRGHFAGDGCILFKKD